MALLNNKLCDKKRDQCYKMGSGKNDSTWLNGIPLWNLAQMQGLKSVAYFWPESDARFNGMVPNYYYHYSQQSDYQARVDQIVQWLSLDEAQRHSFVAGYFSLVDSLGHEFGPDSKEVFNAVQKVDELIFQLYTRLSRLPYPVNLIVVSDHGMSNVDSSQLIDIDELAIPDNWIVKNTGSRALIYTKDTSELDIAAFVKNKHSSERSFCHFG
jgi:predicted AlkP superfamily pyrophosphatase or phosphodiesterase